LPPIGDTYLQLELESRGHVWEGIKKVYPELSCPESFKVIKPFGTEHRLRALPPFCPPCFLSRVKNCSRVLDSLLDLGMVVCEVMRAEVLDVKHEIDSVQQDFKHMLLVSATRGME
jgi:hypothetical protein